MNAPFQESKSFRVTGGHSIADPDDINTPEDRSPTQENFYFATKKETLSWQLREFSGFSLWRILIPGESLRRKEQESGSDSS